MLIAEKLIKLLIRLLRDKGIVIVLMLLVEEEKVQVIRVPWLKINPVILGGLARIHPEVECAVDGDSKTVILRKTQ
ncbi:MAG: hypothetical protein ACE5J0_00850 [Candidatus Paceibacterales bacterium]